MEACTQKSLYTGKLSHTDRDIYTRTEAYPQKLLRTEALTQRSLYTEAFTQRKPRRVSTRKLWDREVVTQRSFYTQKVLCREVLTQWCFYAQKLLHREFFTQRGLYAQKLLDREVFTRRTFVVHQCLTFLSIRAKGLRLKLQNRNFTPVLDMRSSFRAKGLQLRFQHRKLTSVFDVRPLFRAKWLHLIFQHCNFTPTSISTFPFDVPTSHCRQTFILCKRVSEVSNLQFTPVFVIFDPDFVRKGDATPQKNSHFATRLRVRHARSPQKVVKPQQKGEFHHRFVRPMRTIPAQGCCPQGKFTFHRTFVRPTRTQRVHPAQTDLVCPHTFVRPTRTIYREGHIS